MTMTKRLASMVVGLAWVCLVWSASAGTAANPKNGNENINPAAISEKNYWKTFNEWEALMEGKGGIPKDQAKADQILTRLIKGVYLVKFGTADGFNPQTPGEFLNAFYKTSTLKSDKNRLGGSGFFRTKRENDKLTASFLTEQPDKMKQDIERNPQLVFISMEEITPDNFIAHVKSRQESLRNETGSQSSSPIAGNPAEPACTPQLNKLLKAVEANDYERFVADGTSSFKTGITKQIFEGVSAQMIPRMKLGYKAQYLGSLKQRGQDVSVWKIIYKDGGDDTLAKMWLQDGKVAGFLLQ